MGRSWVLIRGLGHERAHWGSFIPRMQEQFPEDELYCTDLLGCGEHCNGVAPVSVPKLMEAVRRDARKQAEPPYLLLTISLGSMVGYAWAMRYPDEVQGLVLMNTSFYLSPCTQRLRWQVWLPFLRGMLTRDPEASERLILPIISAQGEFSEALIQQRADILRRHPVSRANRIRQTAAAAFYRGGKEAPSVPTLILSSAGDRLCSPKCSETFSSRWGVPNYVHPTAGHDLTMDAEDWVLERLRHW